MYIGMCVSYEMASATGPSPDRLFPLSFRFVTLPLLSSTVTPYHELRGLLASPQCVLLTQSAPLVA